MDKHLCPMQPDRQTDKTNYQQIRCALNRQIFTKKDKTSILNRRENHVVYFYISAICSIMKSLTYNFYQRSYSINANVRPSVCLSVCLSVCMSVCMSVSVCLPVCPSVCMVGGLFACLYACLCVCVSVCLCVCIYVYMYVCMCVGMCVHTLQNNSCMYLSF